MNTKEYNKAYYKKHKKEIIAKRVAMNKKVEYKKKYKISHREYHRRMRKACIDLMGGKCIFCGFADYRALQIDHINGGGSKERKVITRNFKHVVMDSFLKKESKYQLLCANCNWIKRYEKSENRLIINI